METEAIIFSTMWWCVDSPRSVYIVVFTDARMPRSVAALTITILRGEGGRGIGVYSAKRIFFRNSRQYKEFLGKIALFG